MLLIYFQGVWNLNPIPFYDEYVGHKFHLDHNKKMVMFGVIHVMAVDGLSGKMVGHATMPIKNNKVNNSTTLYLLKI